MSKRRGDYLSSLDVESSNLEEKCNHLNSELLTATEQLLQYREKEIEILEAQIKNEKRGSYNSRNNLEG
jgi:DNA repair ATPase RecN